MTIHKTSTNIIKAKYYTNSWIGKKLSPDPKNGIFTWGYRAFLAGDEWINKQENHEAIHMAQRYNMGLYKFRFKYFIEYLKCKFKKISYKNISFEIEAYDNAYDDFYVQNKYNVIVDWENKTKKK